MSTFLVLLTGWAAVGVLAVVDRRLAGTWVTPFTVLALPFQSVLTLTAVLARPVGFVAPAAAPLAMLIGGVLVFWCGEAAVLVHARPLPPVERGGAGSWRGEAESRTAALVVSWILVAIMGIAFVRAFGGVGVLGNIVQQEFREQAESGLAGFARPLAMLLVVYWIGTAPRWRSAEAVAAAALFVLLFLSFVKGTVLLPLVGGLIYRAIARGMHMTPGRVVTFVAAVIVLFFAVYGAETAVWGVAGLLAPGFALAVARHLLSYVFAGVLGFSLVWESGILPGPGAWATLIAPVWNLVAHLGGFERVSNLPSSYVLVDLKVDPLVGTSNVRTIVGQIAAFGGPLGAVAVMFGLGLGLGLLYAAARRGRNAWLLAVSAFLGAALFFGWFDYYFYNALWYVAVPPGLLAGLAVRLGRRGRAIEGMAHA